MKHILTPLFIVVGMSERSYSLRARRRSTRLQQKGQAQGQEQEPEEVQERGQDQEQQTMEVREAQRGSTKERLGPVGPDGVTRCEYDGLDLGDLSHDSSAESVSEVEKEEEGEEKVGQAGMGSWPRKGGHTLVSRGTHDVRAMLRECLPATTRLYTGLCDAYKVSEATKRKSSSTKQQTWGGATPGSLQAQLREHVELERLMALVPCTCVGFLRVEFPFDSIRILMCCSS